MEKELERPKKEAKVQSLRKKNNELSVHTRKLEEKVKNLEKKSRELPKPPKSVQQQPEERVVSRKTVASKLREREGEFQRQVLQRDKEIETLRERLKVLSKKLTSKKSEFPKDFVRPKGPLQERERDASGLELDSIIRQVTKERMQLERHLQIANEGLQRNSEVDYTKYMAMEDTNNHLRQQLESLDNLFQEHKVVELQYQQKDEECRELMNNLKFKSELCNDLENQLSRVIDKNTELTIANSDLKKKVNELHQVSSECDALKSTLSSVEEEAASAKLKVSTLTGKVNDLENMLTDLKMSNEQKKVLEEEHNEALKNLENKQSELNKLMKVKEDNIAAIETIERLKAKIIELTEYSDIQDQKQEELIREITELKKDERNNSRISQSTSDNQSQTPQPITSSPTAEGANQAAASDKSIAELDESRNSTRSSMKESPPSFQRSNSLLGDSGYLSSSSIIHYNAINDTISSLSNFNQVNDPEKDMLEIPGKGHCYVYIAKYSYDPFQHSPNDNPEGELQLNAGDYVLIWGDVDEDGFYEGELFYGRKGLVPSNFVEKLVGEDLVEFHKSVILGMGDCDESISTSIPQDLDFLSGYDSETFEETYSRSQYDSFSYLESDDCAGNLDDDYKNDNTVLAPKQLTLESQSNKTVLISWNPPDSNSTPIECFRVYVNGILKTTVSTKEKLRALIEDIDSSRPCRISVRSVSTNGRCSRDGACTMIIGKNAPLAPSCVKAVSVTSTSAVISWLPSNSNFMHAVCINNIEVRTLKPGVFRHTIMGLNPNTTYRVAVRAKNLKSAMYSVVENRQFDRLSGFCEVKTLPKGLPDAPVDVQVDEASQDNSVLVSWLPVTINKTGTSNGALVTGYAVYADGKRIVDVNNATSDHAVVDLSRVLPTPKAITVRTKSRENLSVDSVQCPVPPGFCVRPKHAALFDDLDSDIGPSELSDIAEEDEFISDQEDELQASREMNNHINNRNDMQNPINAKNYNGGVRINGYSKYNGIAPNSNMVLNNNPSPSHNWNKTSSYYDERDRLKESDSVHSDYNFKNSEKKERMRIFVALFDYDPQTMSPNPDTSDEELPFREGQLIKIFGEKDADGFYWGEAGDLGGFVPCNMVSEVQVDDERVARELLKEDNAPSQQSNDVNNGKSRAVPRDRWGDIYESMPVRRMIALYDYEPSELSPNVDSEVELSFRVGDIVYVYGDMDDDGFYMGELRDNRGLVPSNFLTEAPTDKRMGPPPPPRTSYLSSEVSGAIGPPPPPRRISLQHSTRVW